jgi:transposase
MCFEQMRREEKRLYKQLFYMARRQADIKLLMSCPGVGPLVATAFVATIDDPKRFKNSKQLAAYLGLVPSLYQSGETEYRGRITKNGDALLRRLLVEAATVLLTRTRKDCSLKTWGLRLQDSKGFAKARVAVARKLSGILWSMWLDNAEFAYA